MRRAAALALIALAACRPPATDDYVERVPLDGARTAQRAPIASPDAEDAVWSDGGREDRIVYGIPGDTPFLALACEDTGATHVLRATRFVAADPHAKALMALVGNGHISRFQVDAEWNGRAWLWEGRYAPADPRLAVFTGGRKVELTVPGAGTLALNPSPRPGQLIERCRQLAEQAAPGEEPAEPA